MVCLNAQKETHDVFLQMMKTLLGVEMPENEFLKLMHNSKQARFPKKGDSCLLFLLFYFFILVAFRVTQVIIYINFSSFGIESFFVVHREGTQ